MTRANEKSDLPKAARKRANKAVSTAAEFVEQRGGAKENADLQSTVQTQSREALSRAQTRIRELRPAFLEPKGARRTLTINERETYFRLQV